MYLVYRFCNKIVKFEVICTYEVVTLWLGVSEAQLGEGVCNGALARPGKVEQPHHCALHAFASGRRQRSISRKAHSTIKPLSRRLLFALDSLNRGLCRSCLLFSYPLLNSLRDCLIFLHDTTPHTRQACHIARQVVWRWLVRR
jgi:hypothetical protein